MFKTRQGRTYFKATGWVVPFQWGEGTTVPWQQMCPRTWGEDSTFELVSVRPEEDDDVEWVPVVLEE
jgi:hypothetical protein